MNLVLFLLAASRRTVVGAVILGVLSGATSAGLIAVISTAITGNDPSFSLLLAAFVALAIASATSRLGSQWLLLRLAHDAIYRLRLRLCRQIVGTPLAQLEGTGQPRLLATLTDDVIAVTDAVMGLPFLLINAVTIGGCLAYLAWLSPAMFTGVIGLMLLGVVTFRAIESRAVRALGRARQTQDSLFGLFRSVGEGVKELKLNAARRREFLDRDLAGVADEYRRATLQGMGLYTLGGTWAQLLLVILIGALVFGWSGQGGQQTALVTSYALVLLYMLRPMDFVLQMVPFLGRATVAMRHIEALGLELADETDKATAAETAPLASGDDVLVELRGAMRRYPAAEGDEPFVLGPLDLTVRAGEILFVTGGNGSGKSTLVKVLTGLYAADEGELRLGGQRVGPESIDWYRQHFAAVFADFHLFERLLCDPDDVRLERAAQYLDRLELIDKVRIVDGKLANAGLSHGQRRRLALLVAWLEDRPIYVFDEWAADQDPHFKRVFYETLLPQLRDEGRAVVVVTHDDRYFHVADRLVKLESGRLVEAPQAITARDDADRG